MECVEVIHKHSEWINFLKYIKSIEVSHILGGCKYQWCIWWIV